MSDFQEYTAVFNWMVQTYSTPKETNNENGEDWTKVTNSLWVKRLQSTHLFHIWRKKIKKRNTDQLKYKQSNCLTVNDKCNHLLLKIK